MHRQLYKIFINRPMCNGRGAIPQTMPISLKMGTIKKTTADAIHGMDPLIRLITHPYATLKPIYNYRC